MNRLQEIQKFFNQNCGDWGRDDVEYLLSIIEEAEKALEYYANLNQNAYHDAMEGELYSDWWKRQSHVAIKALQAIRKGD